MRGAVLQPRLASALCAILDPDEWVRRQEVLAGGMKEGARTDWEPEAPPETHAAATLPRGRRRRPRESSHGSRAKGGSGVW
jgi:hypothetical protein